ncbi:beta-aspartyl-peptidase (threonine type) [Mesonia algae]|uniref:Beta-aspartyl-peptidase (Threonine type) n=1 Tax=Mesonia algae TaxID=213248 RepID=A0A2W7K8V8_9FLAO|nr:beta-aspartyl-peptidase (threonine type) [Mesonia algae]
MILIFTCKEYRSSLNAERNTAEIKNKKVANYSIAIHGGASYIKKEIISNSLEKVYHDKLKESTTKRNEILKNGGFAIETVKQTLNLMEDSPLFNSGKVASFFHTEKPELDDLIK